jgi:aspartyl-tRNA(Asn)/glutamyl-tRNA(Gln) amidotransferase subunit A
MNTSELISLSVGKMREHLLQGDFTAEELCKAHLDRISATNPQFNSFLKVLEDSAIRQAKSADALLAAGKENTPALTGIPVAVKDNLLTQGYETTAASKILKGFVAPYDATVVAKLKKSGAIILGKTNLDEFAMGSSNENSSFGAVRNPWDLDRVPGGSSGGSAVAVSLGQAPLSLGTDTGGSIRQPAGLTGTIGLKPTYGRVSRYGVIAYASSLDQVGPFGRTPEDIATILEVLSGIDQRDATSMPIPVPKFSSELAALRPDSLKGLRVGVPKQYFLDGMENEVESCIRRSLEVLKLLGATLVDISLPHTQHALSAYYVLAPAEASSNLARYDGVRYGPRVKGESLASMYARTRGEGFGAEVKRRILVGTYVLSKGYFDAYYLKAQSVRTLIINDFKAAFANHCDVIATPVSPRCAWKLGDKTASPLQMYLEDVFTIPVNLAGLPGISVPAGLDSRGLPIGMQIIAPAFEELKLLQVAKAFLNAQPFEKNLPTMRTYK